MPVMTMDTESGAVNLPPGVKESGGRADFDPKHYLVQIETHGYRIAWSRASLCPCTPNNEQTDQSDPNCPLCTGSGWLYFAPHLATIKKQVTGELTPLQLSIVSNSAAVIRGIMSGMRADKRQYNELGSWVEGMCSLTVRHENKLGYLDRITNLDSMIAYSQRLTAGDPLEVLETNYPIVQVNLLRSVTTTYEAPDDFSINATGGIVWNTSGNNPGDGESLAIHYTCHPTWLVVEHPRSFRTTTVARKVKDPITPAGDPVHLPIFATLRYEFLHRSL